MVRSKCCLPGGVRQQQQQQLLQLLQFLRDLQILCYHKQQLLLQLLQFLLQFLSDLPSDLL
jgi:hypothetical protein